MKHFKGKNMFITPLVLTDIIHRYTDAFNTTVGLSHRANGEL